MSRIDEIRARFETQQSIKASYFRDNKILESFARDTQALFSEIDRLMEENADIKKREHGRGVKDAWEGKFSIGDRFIPSTRQELDKENKDLKARLEKTKKVAELLMGAEQACDKENCEICKAIDDYRGK